MVIIREYNTITNGLPYAIVRDRIKAYWKNHNGKVLTKSDLCDSMYTRYLMYIIGGK